MYFSPPPTVTAEIFTRLPDRYRTRKPTAWANANRGGEAIDSFLEGPVFDRQGRLYVTDIPHGRIFRIAPDGTWDLVAEYDGWPNGLKIHRDGRIFITCGLSIRRPTHCSSVKPSRYCRLSSSPFDGALSTKRPSSPARRTR